MFGSQFIFLEMLRNFHKYPYYNFSLEMKMQKQKKDAIVNVEVEEDAVVENVEQEEKETDKRA